MKDSEARRTAATNNILIDVTDRRLRELERRFDALLDHLGVEFRYQEQEVLRKKQGGDDAD